MRKNVAGQFIAAQLAALTDGAPVTTGTTTVYVTIDNGTQASGGTATHKGNGSWSFAPSAANVNGNHVVFTFVNTLAVAVTLNVYPVSFDPTDATTLGLANLDAAVSSRSTFAGGAVASVAAGVTLADDAITAAKIAVDAGTEIAAAVWDAAPPGTPLVDFAEAVRDVDNTAPAADSLGEAINAAGGGGGAGDPWTTLLPGAYGVGSAGKIVGDNLNATVGSRATQASVDAVDDLVDTEVAAIKADTAAIKLKTDNLPASPAAVGSNMGTVASVTGAVGSVTGTVNATLVTTALDAIPMTLTAAPTNFREWMVWLTLRFRRTRRVKATGVISVYGSNGTSVVTTQMSTDTVDEQTTGVTT